MTIDGTRNERARQSLSSIGTAVLNGGVSTFLAFVLLASSKSHVFLTFYKVEIICFFASAINFTSIFL